MALRQARAPAALGVSRSPEAALWCTGHPRSRLRRRLGQPCHFTCSSAVRGPRAQWSGPRPSCVGTLRRVPTAHAHYAFNRTWHCSCLRACCCSCMHPLTLASRACIWAHASLIPHASDGMRGGSWGSPPAPHLSVARSSTALVRQAHECSWARTLLRGSLPARPFLPSCWPRPVGVCLPATFRSAVAPLGAGSAACRRRARGTGSLSSGRPRDLACRRLHIPARPSHPL